MPNFDFLTKPELGNREQGTDGRELAISNEQLAIDAKRTNNSEFLIPNSELNSTTAYSLLPTASTPARSEEEDSPWGIIISFLFHFIILITLAFMPIYRNTNTFPEISLVATLDSSEESMVPEEDFGDVAVSQAGGMKSDESTALLEEDAIPEAESENPAAQLDDVQPVEMEANDAARKIELEDVLSEYDSKNPDSGETAAGANQQANEILQRGKSREGLESGQTDEAVGGGVNGRANEGIRQKLLKEGGGNSASEQAADRALAWIALHQYPNGAWSFSFDKHPNCRGACKNSGTETSDTGATALALLAFMGKGNTHVSGEYQQTVKQGFTYLASKGEFNERRGMNFRRGSQHGSMYAHAISTLALCEIYELTKDGMFLEPIQECVNYITYNQAPTNGGWRYEPEEPGDTTMTVWMLMALRSAQKAGATIPRATWINASKFLDSVSSDHWALYGYKDNAPRRSTTAVGLFGRMFTGWRRTEDALDKGTSYLNDWGPSEKDVYYNYYATLVLRHYEGPRWRAWNPKMRDYLISTQTTTGHESGSWFFPGEHNEAGGRLYVTALCAMTLQVYYRYMPLYRPETFYQDAAD